MPVIIRDRTSLDDLRALVTDLGHFLQQLPHQVDEGAERAIASTVVQCELALDPTRPRLLAIVTDAPEVATVRAACTVCEHLEAIESTGALWWAATLARQHAVGTGHAVHLVEVIEGEGT